MYVTLFGIFFFLVFVVFNETFNKNDLSQFLKIFIEKFVNRDLDNTFN